LGDRVRLNSPVRAIVRGDTSVRLHTADGTVAADACVITVPASVWRDIEFTPALPGGKAEALDGVEYAHAATIAVELPEPVRASAILSVSDFYWTWSATRGRRAPDAVLNCCAGSDTALATPAIEKGPETLLRRLAGTHPDLHLDPSRALMSTWDDDPRVRAAYSTRVPGRDHAVEARRRPVGAYPGPFGLDAPGVGEPGPQGDLRNHKSELPSLRYRKVRPSLVWLLGLRASRTEPVSAAP
jgi:monoamine oxidase